jgi:hypothetical protein
MGILIIYNNIALLIGGVPGKIKIRYPRSPGIFPGYPIKVIIALDKLDQFFLGFQKICKVSHCPAVP